MQYLELQINEPNEWRNIVDNTLTGSIPPGNASSPETGAAELATTRKRDVKGILTFLAPVTALLIALAAVIDGVGDFRQAITDLFNINSPETSEWTEDKAVVIEPNENISTLTIQICDNTSDSGESMHIAFLLGKDSGTLPPAFVLEKKGCRGEKDRVWMNPDDFGKHITQALKADFKLSYSRAHLHSLDQLVTAALNHCNDGTPFGKESGGN
jgi:hypothetical protein